MEFECAHWGVPSASDCRDQRKQPRALVTAPCHALVTETRGSSLARLACETTRAEKPLTRAPCHAFVEPNTGGRRCRAGFMTRLPHARQSAQLDRHTSNRITLQTATVPQANHRSAAPHALAVHWRPMAMYDAHALPVRVPVQGSVPVAEAASMVSVRPSPSEDCSRVAGECYRSVAGGLQEGCRRL